MAKAKQHPTRTGICRPKQAGARGHIHCDEHCTQGQERRAKLHGAHQSSPANRKEGWAD